MAEKIQIYGERLSPFVERLYLQVKFKDIFDKVEFPGMPEGGLKSEEYLGISPLGKMPALKQGDFSLFEAGVISDYLESEFPEPSLLPASNKERAMVFLFIRTADAYFHPQFAPMMAQLLAKEKDQAVIDHAICETRKCLGILEGLMSSDQRPQSDGLLLCDLTLFSSFFLGVKYFPVFGARFFEGFPGMEEWYNNRLQQPFFQESVEVREKQLNEFIANLMKKKT